MVISIVMSPAQKEYDERDFLEGRCEREPKHQSKGYDDDRQLFRKRLKYERVAIKYVTR